MPGIRQTAVMRGPSIWARGPVIHLVLAYPERATYRCDSILTDQLLAALPSLEDHACAAGVSGAFVDDLRAGTSVEHAIEHIAIELQRMGGVDVSPGMPGACHGRDDGHVLYAYGQEDVALAAGRLAVRLIGHLAGDDPGFDLDGEVRREVIALAEELSYGPSTLEIVSEATRRGIPVLRLDKLQSLVQLGHGRYQRRIWATRTSSTSGVAMDLAGNKALTNQMLADAGIPSPPAEVVRTESQAARAAERIGYPVVLKPIDGNHGRGVCLDLREEGAVRESFRLAKSESRDGAVLVERMIPGRDYRVLVVGQEVVAVAERVPAHVTGDGVHTVTQLVEIVNADPRRGIGHERALTRIVVDAQTTRLLATQGLDVDDVPQVGQVVRLKRTGNMSTGGTAIDRTDEIHPDNVEIALEAAMIVGLDVAGIDFISPDIAQSVHDNGGAICEVNAAPGFRMHAHPTEGLPRQVGRAVVDMLFPPGQPSRIPIIAVTGTNGKTTTTRMIAHMLHTDGHTVGLTTSDGIYINGTQIATGDMAGPDSARMVLRNPRVDAAVLETARGGILRAGLGFDRCDVAVVTNVASDHLGLKGVETLDDLARVKAVVPRAVAPGGVSVLNADDARAVGMAPVAGSEVIYFSMDACNVVVRRHVRNGGRAVVLRETAQGGMLTLLEAKRETSILPARQVPATLEERLRVNAANALAASAAAIGVGVSLASIRDALRTFTTGFWQTPGRFNLLTIDGKQVVLDYCHNAHALTALGDFVRRTRASRSVGVIAIAGDRRDEDIHEFGALAAGIFDHIVIREHDDLRGRQLGEVAALLRDAVLDAGQAPEHVRVVLDEIEAANEAIDFAAAGDLVVVMAYRVGRVWDALVRRQAQGAPVATPAPVSERGPVAAMSAPLTLG